jgi:hypothetical protein
MEKWAGNVAATADELGIARNSLYGRVATLDIDAAKLRAPVAPAGGAALRTVRARTPHLPVAPAHPRHNREANKEHGAH